MLAAGPPLGRVNRRTTNGHSMDRLSQIWSKHSKCTKMAKIKIEGAGKFWRKSQNEYTSEGKLVNWVWAKIGFVSKNYPFWPKNWFFWIKLESKNQILSRAGKLGPLKSQKCLVQSDFIQYEEMWSVFLAANLLPKVQKIQKNRFWFWNTLRVWTDIAC